MARQKKFRQNYLHTFEQSNRQILHPLKKTAIRYVLGHILVLSRFLEAFLNQETPYKTSYLTKDIQKISSTLILSCVLIHLRVFLAFSKSYILGHILGKFHEHACSIL
jgi:methionyl-tRNA synthetase